MAVIGGLPPGPQPHRKPVYWGLSIRRTGHRFASGELRCSSMLSSPIGSTSSQLESLVKDLTDEQMVSQPNGVVNRTPARTLRHLASSSNIFSPLPWGWSRRPRSECRRALVGRICPSGNASDYPSKAELLNGVEGAASIASPGPCVTVDSEFLVEGLSTSRCGATSPRSAGPRRLHADRARVGRAPRPDFGVAPGDAAEAERRRLGPLLSSRTEFDARGTSHSSTAAISTGRGRWSRDLSVAQMVGQPRERGQSPGEGPCDTWSRCRS